MVLISAGSDAAELVDCRGSRSRTAARNAANYTHFLLRICMFSKFAVDTAEDKPDVDVLCDAIHLQLIWSPGLLLLQLLLVRELLRALVRGRPAQLHLGNL